MCHGCVWLLLCVDGTRKFWLRSGSCCHRDRRFAMFSALLMYFFFVLLFLFSGFLIIYGLFDCTTMCLYIAGGICNWAGHETEEGRSYASLSRPRWHMAKCKHKPRTQVCSCSTAFLKLKNLRKYFPSEICKIKELK